MSASHRTQNNNVESGSEKLGAQMLGTVVLVYKNAFRGRAKAARGLTEGSRHSVGWAKTKSDHRQNGRRATPEKMCPSGVHSEAMGIRGSVLRTTGSQSCQPWAHESCQMATILKPVAILARSLGG